MRTTGKALLDAINGNQAIPQKTIRNFYRALVALGWNGEGRHEDASELLRFILDYLSTPRTVRVDASHRFPSGKQRGRAQLDHMLRSLRADGGRGPRADHRRHHQRQPHRAVGGHLVQALDRPIAEDAHHQFEPARLQHLPQRAVSAAGGGAETR